MGYVAARGGLEAILAAEELVRRRRAEGNSSWLELDQLTERLRLLVDRVMAEGGLWAPELAARAVRQAEGDPIEAATLVRAHRSTLPRLAVSTPISTDRIEVLRRIVPAYRTPPGPQLLGRTLDYVGRTLDTTDEDDARDAAARAAVARAETVDAATEEASGPADRRPRRLLALLRDLDLVVDRRRDDDPEPYDISRDPVRPGVPRSALLSVMARAEAGALVNLWYRNILGPDGHLHEITLGEVRHGRLPVEVVHPLTGAPVTLGEVRVTEVEAIEDLDGVEEDRGRFDVGYGLVTGHDERKAIAMANLDIAVHRDGGRSSLTQSVLMTTDGLEASGFLEHLKLPHYVTFRSMVERKQAVRNASAVTA
jgi:alpha-D-ribose 1-methylphosphonate 5-triphosphate synthase subunit PhnI